MSSAKSPRRNPCFCQFEKALCEPIKILELKCSGLHTRLGTPQNVSMIHRIIPYSYRTHLDDEETESSPHTLQPFDNGASTEHYEDWILCRWSLQVKDTQPSLCLTIVHHQQSNLKLCSSYTGNDLNPRSPV